MISSIAILKTQAKSKIWSPNISLKDNSNELSQISSKDEILKKQQNKWKKYAESYKEGMIKRINLISAYPVFTKLTKETIKLSKQKTLKEFSEKMKYFYCTRFRYVAKHNTSCGVCKNCKFIDKTKKELENE